MAVKTVQRYLREFLEAGVLDEITLEKPKRSQTTYVALSSLSKNNREEAITQYVDFVLGDFNGG